LLRIKDVCFLKSITVALIWGTAIFGINWVIYPTYVKDSISVLFLMVSFTYATFSNTVFADIRDYNGDQDAGVKTIPVYWGIKKTYRYLLFIPSVLIGICLPVFLLSGLITGTVFWLSFFNLVYPFLYITLYEKKIIKNDKFIALLADSCVILFAIGLLIAATVST
jgi:4-hydroxybenzoate polyprenyltransferase